MMTNQIVRALEDLNGDRYLNGACSETATGGPTGMSCPNRRPEW